ncbi:hypothetical protein FHS29_001935 [Saccharothrix tamanrassetensis]|uniref:Uncharacterized protein n=1 Tax=Saccharothrix tamanrassetensis TaxID=1051531 RepID=A0A841CG66_9PSEU|nr:hypothetical protein [Saccharothrix tamanrassetensis]MBB5955354.1 hypothetical protein [Saccharothrix tamanrassetensis]
MLHARSRTAEAGAACERQSARGGTVACLAARPGVPPMAELVVTRAGREQRHEVPGIPSRLQVSPSGRMVSWTVFVSGDSYNTAGFSTRTGILDTETDDLRKSIEDIPLTVDGKRYFAPDLNFWGVTFGADDSRFYATAASRGTTHLIEADYRGWEAEALRDNVECPSLSPDGTRLAFKKRVTPGPWQLHVLDLATMAETPLAEARSVDDQAVWLDADTVGYGLAKEQWSVPADGTGEPARLP